MADTGKPSEQGVFNVSIKDPVERIQAYIDGYRLDPHYAGWDVLLMRHTKVISARKTNAVNTGAEAFVVFEIEVLPEMCSSMGNGHGGFIATLVDNTTTMAAAPLSEEGFWDFGGLSRSLSITYLRPIPQGITIVSENMVRSVGKRLTAIQCIMKDKATGKILALAEHNKAALDASVRRKAPALFKI
ncbi:Putative Thioesterase domain, HotDog domain superfamily, acyl-coenzyme A thioesterase 13 [Septoria linicola]|uniref:Thioesterase domain, HotDog domain superfamily, acyl-coenzyme A thioesterase 13 n=1 Tax=Septoria linicola TaxID=215465 RepID=A0A9Q9B6C0_9PEZI|nr:Putative Thioesterase domain, HotDog domain superfamily, acyl-coenzyme A thioesterase 13 [Septoria linicola]